jgi:hypothetical protein
MGLHQPHCCALLPAQVMGMLLLHLLSLLLLGAACRGCLPQGHSSVQLLGCHHRSVGLVLLPPHQLLWPPLLLLPVRRLPQPRLLRCMRCWW